MNLYLEDKVRVSSLALSLLLSVGIVACGQPDATPPAEETKPLVLSQAPSAVKKAPTKKIASKTRKKKIPDARRTFSEVMQLIADKYVDSDLPEDELWSGAIEGVLRRLIQIKDREINTMLDPAWVKEMKLGLKGSFSGVGVVIKVIEEVVVIRQVLPDGPAHKAGIKAGDRILAVDGKSVRGLELMEIVQMIRGKTGTTVKLFLQRETEEWVQPVIRGKVTVPAASGQMLQSQVAYVRISTFNHKTVEQLDPLLGNLVKQGAKGVLLDLRGCPGGLLDVSIEVADRFLPAGSRIISIKRRGGAEEVRSARGDHPADRLPVVVLIGPSTASGAEIVAAALSEHKRATLVGEPTVGKGTVETILKLQNGWALKLSVARFYSPEGNSLQGDGVSPDFWIPRPGRGAGRSLLGSTTETLLKDPQVQAGLRVLSLGR